MYSWDDVAERTEIIYKKIIKTPPISLADRLIRYHTCGPFAGKLAVMIMAVDYLLYSLLEWLQPRKGIDLAPTFDLEMFRNYLKKIKHKLL
jgi:phosphatidylinositol N-acetylglucosaminyltransferase subunit A